MLAELARKLADGALSSHALADEAFAVAGGRAATHVFIEAFEEAARMAAESSDLLRKAGACEPLCGVPVTVKANLDVAGRITTAGSRVLARQAPAERDCVVVRRLKRAGMVVLGHTNMTELAFSGLGLNPHYGMPVNPAFARPHIPGGSSAGAAVSVALGMAPVAVGTDTGGSIRVPAAFCGLVGFKPTAALIPTAGVTPLSTTLDTVGVIAKSVDDCATLFEVLAKDAPVCIGAPQARRTGVAGLRIGVISNYVNDGMEPGVAKAIDQALRRLSEAGAIVGDVAIPELDGIPRLNARGSFSAIEVYAFYLERLEAGRDRIDPRVLSRIEAGRDVRACDYLELQAGRRALVGAFERRAADWDLIAMPTTPVIAPAIPALAEDEAYHRLNGLILRNPSVVNMVDGCAVSLPCQAPGEAPVGLTLAAPRGCDARLLRLAAALEPVVAG
jgi:aspartyl-tRNA(Asn)/glutamyl-tRNA(Gln) amidotransferase subunit A